MTKRQTANYGWWVPNDDELVRDGADAIRVLADGIDASLKPISDRAKPDLATRTWVGQQDFATTAYSKSLNSGGIGSWSQVGAKVLVGTAVVNIGAYSGATVTYPTSVGFTNVFSVTVCNGDFSAAAATVHLYSSSTTGFVATFLAATKNAAGAVGPNVGEGFHPGRAVRVNYCAVGI